MILLLDDRINDMKDKRIEAIRDFFLAEGIPCLTVRSVQVTDHPTALAVFLFTPSDDHLRTVSVRCKRIPILAVNESGSRIYNNDAVFYDAGVHGSYESFILDFLRTKYGITCGNYVIGDLSVVGDAATYGMNPIKLTPTERKILVLLMMCKNQWISEDEVGRVCLGSRSKTSSITVHVCNMNKKFKIAAGKRLIRTKRGAGYMINEREV